MFSNIDLYDFYWEMFVYILRSYFIGVRLLTFHVDLWEPSVYCPFATTQLCVSVLWNLVCVTFALKKKRFYLFICREEKGGRETSMWGCLLHTPYWGPGPQPRPVPVTGNQTGDPLVHRLALNLLNHTGQGALGSFETLYGFQSTSTYVTSFDPQNSPVIETVIYCPSTCLCIQTPYWALCTCQRLCCVSG